MKRGAGESGSTMLEILLVLLLLGGACCWAVPEAVRMYKYGAVRYEAEQLLSELRYEQMAARTAAQSLAGDGSVALSGTRPRLMMTGKGYIVYRGWEIVKRHNCISPVKMQFHGGRAGSQELLYFSANGDVFPNVTIKVFAPGGEGIHCWLVIDEVGRFRLERGIAGE